MFIEKLVENPTCFDRAIENLCAKAKSKKDKDELERLKNLLELTISSNKVIFENVEKEAVKNGFLQFNTWKELLLDGKLPESKYYKSRSEIQTMKDTILDHTLDFDKELERLLKQEYRKNVKIKIK